MKGKNQNKIGALPAQRIKKMIEDGEILNADKKNIQPASIDLSISDEGYRIKGTFLPGKSESVRDIIKSESLYKINLDHPLEKNGVYLIRLNESLDLPRYKFAFSSSKSSTGRVDLQARTIVDGHSRFDNIPVGYKGELWIQVVPKSFLVKLNPQDKLNQIRFFSGEAKMNRNQILKSYTKHKLLFDENSNFISANEKLAKNNINALRSLIFATLFLVENLNTCSGQI